jgi:hypothetical protein
MTEQCSNLNWIGISFELTSIVNHINQSFELWDMPAFKMSIYYKLKLSYIIKLVIIKHALVKELLILQVQNYDIKPW